MMTEVHAGIVEAQPKDTGFAAANWIPNIGVPFTSVVTRRDKVESTEQTNKVAELQNYTDQEDFRNIWITNNVDYVLANIKGNSRQAPENYPELVVQRITAKYDGRIIQIK